MAGVDMVYMFSGPDSSAVESGDEALMVYRRTGCPTAVADSRSEAVKALLATHALQVILADDGLQHYALARDLEVVMYDGDLAFGSGHCLPVGPLREPLSRLQRADLVLAKGGDGEEGITLRPAGLVNLTTAESRPFSPDSLGEKVYAVAGIAAPDGFLALLAAAGFSACAHLFADHHSYSRKDFEGLGDRPIIMTEKDAVKCRDLAGVDAWYLQVDADLSPSLLEAAQQTITVFADRAVERR